MLCLARTGNILELAKLVSSKLGSLLGDVDPQAAMSADAGCALDCEPDRHGVVGLGGEVDVLAGDLGRAVVVEGQQVDLVGNHCWGYHGEGGKGRLLATNLEGGGGLLERLLLASLGT